MIKAYLEGVLLGLTLAVLTGPSFISLVQTSIHRGFGAGVQMAVGVSLSDFTLIAISYFGIHHLLGEGGNQWLSGLIAAGILIAFGLTAVRRRQGVSDISLVPSRVSTGEFLRYFTKGFFLNILNPFLLLFWLGLMGLVSSRYGVQSLGVRLFFAGSLSAIFVTDLLKCFLAHRIKRHLNKKIIGIINKALGFMLIAFGIVLIVRVLFFL